MNIKVNGYIKNITNNEVINIKEDAVKNHQKIIYDFDKVHNILHIMKDKVILLRENNEFRNELTFIENEDTESIYEIKENNYIINLNLFTNKIVHKKNGIKILYTVENNEQYEYNIETGEENEY